MWDFINIDRIVRGFLVTFRQKNQRLLTGLFHQYFTTAFMAVVKQKNKAVIIIHLNHIVLITPHCKIFAPYAFFSEYS
jgi:hypothetical protein